ncbi:hypothetical protein WH47_10171 [Habropoda laboriosa]|uniref:Uncharacterized protein n=1 Tax=Habropoda laboriosa TaxID=597456 RepID=A0A0L7R4F6_9HYME|nr:hypothetical protein WH47_10171 [Habropoda laboriosa]
MAVCPYENGSDSKQIEGTEPPPPPPGNIMIVDHERCVLVKIGKTVGKVFCPMKEVRSGPVGHALLLCQVQDTETSDQLQFVRLAKCQASVNGSRFDMWN